MADLVVLSEGPPTDAKAREHLDKALNRAQKRFTEATRELARVRRLTAPAILAQLTATPVTPTVRARRITWLTCDLWWVASVPVLGGCHHVRLVCPFPFRRGRHPALGRTPRTLRRRYLEAGYLALDNNLSERTLRAIALGRNNWGVIGSEVGGRTAAVLFSVVGTCKHLGIDPFAYLREALPGIFTLGEEPAAEQLLDWLPDRWLLNRMRDKLIRGLTAG